MKFVYVAFAIFLGVNFLTSSSAMAQVSFLEVGEPYEPYLLADDMIQQQVVYSELLGFPDLYEFELAATSTIPVQVRAVDETAEVDFSLILVADEGNAGVREIFRLPARQSVWQLYTDTSTRMSYLVSEVLEPELAPGIYRLEVSTPDNEGRYSIIFGEESSTVGYFARFGEIRSIHNFHGYGPLSMFRTAHVYMPILIVIVLFGLFFTWRYARRNRLV